MSSTAEEKTVMKVAEEEVINESRRNFLKSMAFLSAVFAFSGILGIVRALGPIQMKIPEWPRIKVANIRDLKEKEPIIFNYPLESTPNILVKLGKRVTNGVGPDEDIVAYSQICQHLGCMVRFMPAGSSSEFPDKNLFYCPCHAGFYDADDGAKILAGPPLYPLPPVKLEYDSSTGDIYAVGMGPPVIFGKGPPGSTEVWRDLIGGKLVGGG
ncbi:MAG: arsenate reductase (azurin) small subunit [Candidatus Methanodesulfokora washburnensis]|jgi:arsenite oxidase small subunit